MVESATTHYAVVVLNNQQGVTGTVKFTQVEGKKVRIQAELSGLTPGLHGFHIH